MLRGHERMIGDRGARPGSVLETRLRRQRGLVERDRRRRLEVVDQVLGGAVVLVVAPVVGWLFAAHVDPDGALMRWTLGLLVGEFR